MDGNIIHSVSNMCRQTSGLSSTHKNKGKILYIQGGSNMTGTELCVNKPHCAAAV
jgi:hypothetical protein